MREEEDFDAHRRARLLHHLPGRAAGAGCGAGRRAAAGRRVTSTPWRGRTPSSPARAATTPRRSIRNCAPRGWNGYWIDAASALRMEPRAHHHPGPGQPRRHRRRPGGRQARLHRRQLHRQPDAHGRRRALPRGAGGVGQRHDLPGRLRGRGQEHARTPAARWGRCTAAVADLLADPALRHPGDRPARSPRPCGARPSRRRTSAPPWPGA